MLQRFREGISGTTFPSFKVYGEGKQAEEETERKKENSST